MVIRISSGALLAAVLMCIPLSLLRRSSSPAATPFMLLYSAVAVTAVAMISGRQSEWMMYAALTAALTIPAVLIHLNFTFLSERKVIRDAPGLVLVPYALSAVFFPAAWLALERNPLLWPTFTWLVIGLIAACAGILLISCAYAIRESHSALERARAQVLLFGALFLPVLPTLMLTPNTGELAQVASTYLWVSALVMPLPLGLAISRYNLFNLEWDARRFVGWLVYFAAVALLVTFVLATILGAVGAPHPLRDPAFLFLISFACAVAVEPLRGRLFGYLESMFTPRLQQLRRLREGYTREISQVRDQDEVARLLGRALQGALDPRAGCVFLSVGAEWRPAYAFGRKAPMGRMLVSDALEVLEDRDLVYLALAPEVDTPPRRRLQAEEIELMAAIGSGEERFGVVLLTGAANGSPYTGGDLDFTGMATSHAGIAFRNARLTDELLSSERQATTGRVAVALAHDIGKELDWLGRLVKRLPTRFDDPRRLTRDVSMIQEFADGLTERIHDFVREATDPATDPPGTQKLDLLVQRAVDTMCRIHGEGRITQSIEPGLRNARAHENIGRVLANLLDNALRASPGREPVHVFATLDGPNIKVSVTDHGSGMDRDVLRSAFERGFTTRTDGSGSGIGLTISREIVESLGGSIELSSKSGGGTRATIVIPKER
jgi:signal transduction histidine kinase